MKDTVISKSIGFLVFIVIIAALVMLLSGCSSSPSPSEGRSETASNTEQVVSSEETSDITEQVSSSEEAGDAAGGSPTAQSEASTVGETAAAGPAVTAVTPTTPAPADPALFWISDDYFDIVSYFQACGASEVKWRTDSGLDTATKRHGVYCLIGNRELRVWGVDYVKAHNLINVVITHDDAADDVFNSMDAILAGARPENPETVWVDAERSICMSTLTLQDIFTMMDSFINADCPFAGTSIRHIQTDGSFIGEHSD